MKGGVQVRRRRSGMLMRYQLVGLSKAVALLKVKLNVLMCFSSASSSWSLELLAVMAMEVMLIHPVSDLKDLVELRAFLPGICKKLVFISSVYLYLG